MKRYIRFDSVGGASGDMILAALSSIGADITLIEEQLNSFFPQHLHIKSEPASDSGLNGIRIAVHAHHHSHDDSLWPDVESKGDDHHHHQHDHEHHHDHQHEHEDHHHKHHDHHEHRGLTEISELINGSALPAKTKELAISVFRSLAEAEGKIHGKSADTVHFHEVGAWDSVADIVGSCIALDQLNIAGISCGTLPSGTGTLKCAHGLMPNPAPATQELLEGMPTVQTDEPFELVTPTGAAILATWMRDLEQPPAESVICKNGFGFGTRKLNGRPNVLRATLVEERVAEALTTKDPQTAHTLKVLETNLDDCNPEWLGTLLEDLIEAGALDAWYTPIIMKKGRPAIKLSVLTPEASSERCQSLIFKSTTTFGIRSYAVERSELKREFIDVETQWGTVPVKCGILKGETITTAPEYAACAKLAKAADCTVKEISTAALALYSDKTR